MPTRSSERFFDPLGPEGVLSNHLSSVWVGILDRLHALLHDPHLVRVLEQPLGARVAADHALPARLERHLAPLAALAVGQAHVDEGALAVDRAPLARRVLARRAGVLERL